MENTGIPLDLIALFVIVAGIIGLSWFGFARDKRARMRSWKPDLKEVAKNRPQWNWADDAVVHSSPCGRAEARGVSAKPSDGAEWDVKSPADEGLA